MTKRTLSYAGEQFRGLNNRLPVVEPAFFHDQDLRAAHPLKRAIRQLFFDHSIVINIFLVKSLDFPSTSKIIRR